MSMSFPLAYSIERAGRGAERSSAATDETVFDRLERAPVRTLKSREHLFRTGEDKTNIYQVLEGAIVQYRLRTDGRRQITGFAVTGDMVGLGASISHCGSAESSGNSTVRALAANALHGMARENSHLGMHLYDAVSRELAATQDLLTMVGKLNAGERVATFLLSLARRRARGLGAAERLDLPMTRCDIGDFLGLTTETISRTLTKLAIGQIISRHQGHIRILDVLGLEAVSAGDQPL